MNDGTELKGLNTQKSKILIQLKEVKEQRGTADRTINELSGKLQSIESRIKNLTQNDVLISEHAILRYLERVMNIDMDDIKKDMVSDVVKQRIKALGDGKYPMSDYFLVVKGNIVVTVEGK